jgi:signal peptidase I
MTHQTSESWKRIGRIFTTVAAVAIGLLIAGMVFFKLAPGFGFYVVKTGSMEPSISPGDIIFTAPAANRIEPGRIITFKLDNNLLVTHRVLSIEKGMILTRGDANEDPDKTRISPSQVEGIYLFKIPLIGRITNIMHTRIGWFFIVLVPSFLLVLWIAAEILKEVIKRPKPATAAPEISPGAAGNKTVPESKGMPGRNAVKSIRKDLKDLLKDVYQP